MKTYQRFAYLHNLVSQFNALSGVQARFCEPGYLVIDADYAIEVDEDGEEETEWLCLRLQLDSECRNLILSWEATPETAIFFWPPLSPQTVVRLLEAFITNPLVAQSCAAREAGGVA